MSSSDRYNLKTPYFPALNARVSQQVLPLVQPFTHRHRLTRSLAPAATRPVYR